MSRLISNRKKNAGAHEIADPECSNCNGEGMVKGPKTGRWILCSCVRKPNTETIKVGETESYIKIWASTIEGRTPLTFPGDFVTQSQTAAEYSEKHPDAVVSVLLYEEGFTTIDRYVKGQLKRTDEIEGEYKTAKLAGPFKNKVLLPAALSLGLGLAPGAKEQKPPKPPVTQVQETPATVAGPIDKDDVTSALQTAAKATHIPLAVLVAMAHNETSYGANPSASSGSSGGLMQMTPDALAEVNKVYGTDYIIEDMADPDESALAAAQYMKILLKKFDKDLDAAIAAYNTGPTHVNKVLSEYGEVTPETLSAAGHDITSDYLAKAKARLGPKKYVGSLSRLVAARKVAGPLGNDVFPDGPSDFFEPVRDPHSDRANPEPNKWTIKLRELKDRTDPDDLKDRKKIQQDIDVTYNDMDQPGIPVGASEKEKPEEKKPYEATDEDLPEEFFSDKPLSEIPKERKMWVPRTMLSRLIARRITAVIKLKWTVDPPPVGRYRSFDKRGWPNADYVPSGRPAAHIYCDDEYRPEDIKEGKHAPLTVMIADYNPPPNKGAFVWRRMKTTFATLQQAKEAVAKLLEANPGIQPKS